MLFNSIEFLLFLLITWILYWLVPLRRRHSLLLLASLVFYGSWGWWHFSLMMLTAVTAFLGLRWTSDRDGTVRSPFALTAVVVLLITWLFFFKFNTGLSSFWNETLGAAGGPLEIPFIYILLPAGMSFYVLQICSALIDSRRGDFKWAPTFPQFLNFVTFFPQLMAGPIETAKDLAPQLGHLRNPSREEIKWGLGLLVLGLSKKVLASPPLAAFAAEMMKTPESQSGLHLWAGALCYSSKIYFDFSGYSDMACGAAALFGVRIQRNFDRPLLASTLRELWRRWHMSLTNWIRDYVFIPLGKYFPSKAGKAAAVLISLGLVGIWHGPSVNYLIFGLLHGLLLIINYQFERWWGVPTRMWAKIAGWFVTLLLWIQLAIFFQGQELDRPLTYLKALYSNAWVLDGLAVGALASVFLFHFILDGALFRPTLARRPALVWAKITLLIGLGLAAVHHLWTETPQTFHYFQF